VETEKMPREYVRHKRPVASAQTRARIVTAVREMMTSPEGAATFTIDAVAQRADVARMTVYYQFKSKRGLLEAVFDDLAERGQMNRLREAFANPDPLAALNAFIERFVQFWSCDRLLLRRLYAVASLDREVEASLAERIAWRREGLKVLVKRLKSKADQEVVDTLHMLTSFEVYDALAARGRKPSAVVSIIQGLAHAALDF
jgi:AcrR family transcriptional regulator